MSAETRAKISKSVLAKTHTYVHKCVHWKGKKLSQDHRDKIRAGLLGQKRNEEYKIKASIRAKNRSPEWQTKMTAGIRKTNKLKKEQALNKMFD